MSEIVSIKKMLENGVHFGHQTRRWNPKMKPYIYTSRNGVYIVDLNQTQKQIEDAYKALKQISENGGKVLFVGTKKQAKNKLFVPDRSLSTNVGWVVCSRTSARSRSA